MEDKLPPLPKEVLDGETYEAPIPRDLPLPKSCTHKDVKIISSTEIRCSCSSGWTGDGVYKLYQAFKSQ